ncbi:MAG: hypothetical protein AAF226_13835, partial [Verrucomicrobiota bacterium]
NSDNPFSPPRRIKWGHESTDEMGSITLMGVPVAEEDSRKLKRAKASQNVKALTELGRELKNSGVLERLPRIIKALDKNGDGNLQSSELPARMRSGLLSRLDVNEDEELDASEIQLLKDWLQNMKDSREEA